MSDLTHDQAIDALCGCAATVTVLSYQEAIEGYFKLRGLPIPGGAQRPDGWVLAPREPTPQMLYAALKVTGDMFTASENTRNRAAYSAMVAAFPDAPALQGEEA
ncbi:hypothetical protein [Phenylobacterium sp.]|uniref:hypothetical protein n=1 Tax=Phenylobacterium sp. TaxID=1871053 RepID=UPI002FC84A63